MPPVRFGAFEFEPETGVLRRSGLRVRLQPEAARVLTALAADERSPALVTALVDPQLDTLRADPHFVSLARRVGSKAAVSGGRPLLHL